MSLCMSSVTLLFIQKVGNDENFFNSLGHPMS